MDHKNGISVVIPLFNKGKHIKRALTSALNQLCPCNEIIVINDGSTDDGEIQVKSFRDSRIKLINQNNRGVSSARNRGIDAAKYELIAFLDADDAWEPEFLQTIIHLKKKYPASGIYGTGIKVFRSSKEISQPKYYNIPKEPWEGIIEDYFLTAAFGYPLSSSSTAIYGEIIDDVGSYDERMTGEEDLDLWNRIALKYPVAFSNNICATCHKDAENRSKGQPFSKGRDISISKLESYIKKYDIPLWKEESIREYIARHRINKVEYLIRKRENKKQIFMELRKSKETKLFKRRWLKANLKAHLYSFLPDRLYRLGCRIIHS
jgi:glycosyltransferase involved in cell wall biosynthesis